MVRRFCGSSRPDQSEYAGHQSRNVGVMAAALPPVQESLLDAAVLLLPRAGSLTAETILLRRTTVAAGPGRKSSAGSRQPERSCRHQMHLLVSTQPDSSALLSFLSRGGIRHSRHADPRRSRGKRGSERDGPPSSFSDYENRSDEPEQRNFLG